MRSIIRIIIATLIVAAFNSNAFALKALWQGIGVSGGFATPEEACQAQHDAYASSNPGPVTANRGPYWYMRNCDWVTHAEASVPIAPLPSVATLTCYNDDGTQEDSFDNALVPPQSCVPKTEVAPTRPNCSFDRGAGLNPVVGNPIIVSNGAKFERAEDFSTADGLFRWSRTYRSSAGRNAYGDYAFPFGLGQLWRSNLQWTVALSANVSSDYSFTINTPDGSPYNYSANADGSTTPKETTPGDIAVTLLAAPGTTFDRTALKTAGAVIRIQTADSSVVTMNLVKLGGSSTYNYAAPATIVDRNGYTLTFAYASPGEISSITDSFGRAATFTWAKTVQPDGLSTLYPRAITAVTLPDGSVLAYNYEDYNGVRTGSFGYDRIWKVERRNSAGTLLTSEQYIYDNATFPAALTGIVDNAGIRIGTFAYDGLGRVTSSTHPGGADQTTISYSNSGDNVYALRTVTNALGKSAVYKFERVNFDFRLTAIEGQASTSCAGSLSTVAYNSAGKRSIETDEEGRQTAYSYQTDGRIQSITKGYGTAAASTTSFTWDPTFDLPATIVESGLSTTMTYGATGALTALTETDTSTQTVPYSTNGQTRTTTFTYGTGGRLASIDGPLAGTSDKTIYGYNTSGYLQTVTDPAGLVTTVTAWNGTGQPTSVTDPNGIDIDYGYDGMGRLASVTKDPSGTSAQWQITYDAVGNVTSVIAPSGAELDYTYNTARRLISVANAAGEIITYTYDALGDVTSTTVDDGSSIAFEQSSVYDELGRLIHLVTGVSQTFSTAWDKTGLPVTLTDPRSGVVSLGWDAVARLVTRTAEDLGVETVAYDGKGDVSSYQDPRNLTTIYVRNGFGDVIQETSPDRGTTVYEVDARGLVTKKTDARGVVANMTYDAAGRMTGRTYPASSAENVALSWDGTASGNLGKGRLTGMTDRSGSTAWTYDSRGHITSETRTIGSAVITTAYVWDWTNRLARITYPSGRQVDFEYDWMDRIYRITTRKNASAAEVVVVDAAYRASYGPLQGLVYGNGLSDWYAVDHAYRPTQYWLGGGGTTVDQRFYSYDDGLNLTGINDDLVDSRDLWLSDYDAANRLTQAIMTEGGVTKTYGWTYDKVGNRLSESVTPSGGSTTTTTYAIPTTSNRLSGVSSGGTTLRSFTYDAAGNMTLDQRGSTAFAYGYDNAGRLRTVTAGGSLTGTYTYDGLDRLAVRAVTNVTPSGTTNFVHQLGGGGAIDDLMPRLGAEMAGLGNRVIAETDASGNTLREYIWLGDQIVAAVDGVSTASPSFRFVTNDHLGRPVAMIDSSKTVVWRATYKPFGEPLVITGPAALDARFPGQWFQFESGLAWNWYRHYDASLGRYAQPDPLGVSQGPSVYGYAGQSPLMGVDPQGLQSAALPFGPPMILPPVAIPGTPENRAWTQSVLNLIDRLCTRNQEDPPIDCDKLYESDVSVCRAIAKRRGKSNAARCYATAADRYAACLRGKPLPPFDVYNN